MVTTYQVLINVSVKRILVQASVNKTKDKVMQFLEPFHVTPQHVCRNVSILRYYSFCKPVRCA